MTELEPAELAPSPERATAATAPARLSEADTRGCRWIEGPALPLRHGMYCCAPTLPGSSWCDRHRKIVCAAPRRGLFRKPRA
jgi:hypothetical protein